MDKNRTNEEMENAVFKNFAESTENVEFYADTSIPEENIPKFPEETDETTEIDPDYRKNNVETLSDMIRSGKTAKEVGFNSQTYTIYARSQPVADAADADLVKPAKKDKLSSTTKKRQERTKIPSDAVSPKRQDVLSGAIPQSKPIAWNPKPKPKQAPIAPQPQSAGDGWFVVDPKTLPTEGRFYPDDMTIMYRSASSGEIRQWSTISDDDAIQIDYNMNYMLENCIAVESSMYSDVEYSWKDIIELDRFYIILAIRDLTFPIGMNDLKMDLGNGESVIVRKENVQFLEFHPDVLKRYSDTEKCFILKMDAMGREDQEKTEIRIYMPSLGVSEWLRNYLMYKNQTGEKYDTTFIQYAPYLIPTYDGLDVETYNKWLEKFKEYNVLELSVISTFVGMITKSVVSKFVYTTEEGRENVVPFTFLRSFKNLFLIQDPLQYLD